MPAKVPTELIETWEAQHNFGHIFNDCVPISVEESPTVFCPNTTDFNVNAILAHIRQQRQYEHKLFPGPYHLEVCPTSACSIACHFCSYTIRNESGQSVPLAALLNTLDDAEALGVVGTYFSGGGDPLVYRDICPVVERAAD